MPNRDITLVEDEGGDWTALYSFGKLVAEGHSLTPSVVLEALGLKYDEIVKDLQDGNPLPFRLEDLTN